MSPAAKLEGSETILVVEDEDALRTLLCRFFRLYGYNVMEARHGGEALLLCERHQGPIHLMVTDVVMPQMSGKELADRLAPLHPGNDGVLHVGLHRQRPDRVRGAGTIAAFHSQAFPAHGPGEKGAGSPGRLPGVHG